MTTFDDQFEKHYNYIIKEKGEMWENIYPMNDWTLEDHKHLWKLVSSKILIFDIEVGGFVFTDRYIIQEEEEEDKTCHTCKKEYEVEDGRGGYEGHKCVECFEEEEEEDCECGNNKEKGLVNSQMRCEDCDIDGMNYNGGLTDEEEEETYEEFIKRTEIY